MAVNISQELKKLIVFLEGKNFPFTERVKVATSVEKLDTTIFLCIMEFLMNIVFLNQLKWKCVPIVPDGDFKVKISNESRDAIFKHIIAWEDDLKIKPKMLKSQLTSESPSWEKRRATLLLAALDEVTACLDNTAGILLEQTPKRPKRVSCSLMESFSTPLEHFNGSFHGNLAIWPGVVCFEVNNACNIL